MTWLRGLWMALWTDGQTAGSVFCHFTVELLKPNILGNLGNIKLYVIISEPDSTFIMMHSALNGALENNSEAMAPRQDLIIPVEPTQVQQAQAPPPPPPGRHQRPPHDNPAAYIDRSNPRRPNNPQRAVQRT